MKKLRILLYGNLLNPELDNELRYSEELSPFVETVEKTSILPTAWNFINQGKINTIFVNPYENNIVKPINEEVMKFISDVRKEHSKKIAFVFYTDTEKARQALTIQYPDFEFKEFIKVNYDGEDLDYFNRLKMALKKCVLYLTESTPPQPEQDTSPKPTPQPEPASHPEQLPSSNFPKWGMLFGASLLALAIIFIMALLIANLYDKDITGNGRLLVAALLALVTSAGSGFLGGSAAAAGEIETPQFFRNHITFGLTGGIAVFLVVFLITIAAYGYLPVGGGGTPSNSNTNSNITKSPSPTASSAVTNSVSPTPYSSAANNNSGYSVTTSTDTPATIPNTATPMPASTSTLPANSPVNSPPNEVIQLPEITSAEASLAAGGTMYRIEVKYTPVDLPANSQLYLNAAKDQYFNKPARDQPYQLGNFNSGKAGITINREEGIDYYVRFELKIPNRETKHSRPVEVKKP